MPSLLERARKEKGGFMVGKKVTVEELELCVAYIARDVSSAQVANVLKIRKNLVSAWARNRLFAGCRSGQISLQIEGSNISL